MILQPATSRISPNTWERMSDAQRADCVSAVKHRDLLTKAVRAPNFITDTEAERLGEDLRMAVGIVELAQTEIIAASQDRATGRHRTPAQIERARHEHEMTVLALSGASAEYQQRAAMEDENAAAE